MQEQGKHRGVLPWQTLHSSRTSWASGIVFVFPCLWGIFLPQPYLLFVLTILPASVGRGSTCFSITGGGKGSFSLYHLLGTLEWIGFLLPCSQPKRNHDLFCQSHLSIPHVAKHRSPSFSHNTPTPVLCSSAALCAFLSSWKVSLPSLKSQYFSSHLSPENPHCPRNDMLTISAPPNSLPKYGPCGIGTAAPNCPGWETWAENSTCVGPQEQQCQKKGFSAGAPYFAIRFDWVVFHAVKLSVCVWDFRSSLDDIPVLVPPLLATTARRLPALVTTVQG